ncbi:uncharacterized protein LOC144874066 [Branchiostoma floridae x Branchiostoma japonicum]
MKGTLRGCLTALFLINVLGMQNLSSPTDDRTISPEGNKSLVRKIAPRFASRKTSEGCLRNGLQGKTFSKNKHTRIALTAVTVNGVFVLQEDPGIVWMGFLLLPLAASASCLICACCGNACASRCQRIDPFIYRL